MPLKTCVLCISLFIAAAMAVPADTARRDSAAQFSLSQTALYAGKTLMLDGLQAVAAPVQWRGTQWLTAAAVLGVAGGLYLEDQKIKEWVQRNRNGVTNDISAVAGLAGDGLIAGSALGVWWLGAGYFKNTKAQNCALLGLESVLIAGTITGVIKISVHRHRPNTNDPSTVFNGPALSFQNLSFPSGHATVAFAWAGIVAGMYHQSIFYPMAAYSVATLTALSRLNENEHWASDVIIGGAIGYATSQMVLKLHSQNGNGHVMIMPTVNSRECGLLVTLPLWMWCGR
ncbi:MAG: phosphatase PAP2 family protein [Chitinivibrionales bacterium]|nr:phosphatase PAP2 family protein [Chitinivibrionales bacterium]